MRLFIFGCGYSCASFVRTHGHRFSIISATVRSNASREPLQGLPIELLLMDDAHADPAIGERVANADAILVSVPPGRAGDPVLARYRETIAGSAARVVYLSTVGVYADHGGDWIDESAALVSDDGRRALRVRAESAWRATCGDRLAILRLAGIYGPGRNAFRNL